MGGELGLAGLHRAAGNEDHRNINAHGCHQHAGGDLVAIGDAHHGVGAVSVYHVFNGIGDDVAAGQAIEHAVVTHGDAIVNGDGIELLGDTAGLLNLPSDQLPQVFQVDVAGNELSEGVHHRNDGLLEVFILHPGGAPQCACAGHIAARGGGTGAILRHGVTSN